MKIIAIFFFVILLMASSPFQMMQFDAWQLPLWIADLSWVGIELFAGLVAIIAVIAGIALVSVGLLGAGLIIGISLALLFGSLVIVWPLLLIVFVCWLVTDNQKVA